MDVIYRVPMVKIQIGDFHFENKKDALAKLTKIHKEIARKPRERTGVIELLLSFG